MITINAAGKRVKLDANGNYRIFPSDLESFTSMSVIWTGRDASPAGILSFSLDGDPGQNSELGAINLAQSGTAGSRTCVSNMRLAFVDAALTGLPAGGELTLFLR